MGQVNAFVLVCMTVAILGLDRTTPGWEWSAGAALAMATLVKVTPVLLILLFVARKKRRSLGGFALALGAGVALSMAISGTEVWRQFTAFLPHMAYGRSIDGLFHPMSVANLSLSGFILRAAESAATPVRVVVVLVSALLVGSVLWAAFRPPRVAKLDGVLLAVLVTMVLISPYTWIHHLVFLYPGVFLLLRSILVRVRAGHDRKLLLSVLVCVVGLTINFPHLYPSMGVPEVIRPVVTSMNFFFLLALFAVALRISLRPQRHLIAYRVRGYSRLPAWSHMLPLPFGKS
jgi:alpha-1,2-mannosyltransferase